MFNYARMCYFDTLFVQHPCCGGYPACLRDAALLQQSSQAMKLGAGVQGDAKGTQCHKHAWRCKCFAPAQLPLGQMYLKMGSYYCLLHVQTF